MAPLLVRNETRSVDTARWALDHPLWHFITHWVVWGDFQVAAQLLHLQRRIIACVEIAHFVAIVSTRVSPQTINQKSTVRCSLATWSRCWRCALINSRAARNVFAATVNGTWNRKFWTRKTYCLTKFPWNNVATEGDIAKTASSRPSHGIFAYWSYKS